LRTSWHRAELSLPVRVGALLLFALLWLTPISAEAVDPDASSSSPLVVVMSDNPDSPFVRRLAAELSLFGYRVQVETRSTADDDLTELLETSGGAALIAVEQGKQTVDIVMASGGPGERAGHEHERLDPRRRADTNAAVLAERFRARLTELGIAPAQPSVVAPSAAEPNALPLTRQPAAPAHRLWLAGALGGTSGGLGFVPDAQLELRAFPVLWLSTSAFARLSLLPAEVREEEGATDIRLVAGGVLIDAYPVRKKLVVKAGVGALLVNAQMSGSASAPLLGVDDSVLVPAGLVEVGAAYRLSPRVSAELVGFAGVCAPRVGVRFAGRSVAQYGQPFLGASLGLAVGVF
jgi:hypothetical protein